MIGGALGVALVLGVPGTAGAEVPVSQVGWWTRSPSPPTVPDGGISVGAAPDGALTVGAVLVDTGDGASGASLRLVEASGGAGAQVAGIQVCPTSSSWSAAEGGPMADAPKDDCASASVAMTRGEDGSWTADVQKLLDGKTGDVGLVVLPAADAVAFQLSFAPPIVDGSVTEGSSGSETDTSTTPSFEPAPSSSSSYVAPEPPSTPSFVAPVAPAPEPAVQPSAPISDGSSATAAAVPFDPAAAGLTPGGGGGSHVTKAMLLFWYLLAMAVGAAVAGITWLRNEGRLTPTALLARVRR
jgi:hypothetical protein